MNPKSISVVGCGWLGMPLAIALQDSGYRVFGTLRDLSKIQQNRHLGIDFYQLLLSPEITVLPESTSDFWNADLFIITIPPSNAEYYCKGISILLEVLEKQQKKITIIYTSSTGVYGKAKGLIDETALPNPDRAGAKAAYECEQLLLAKKDIFYICILRLAGLVGPDRVPGRFFAAKKNLNTGKSPVNLVHLNDCIEIIKAIIKNNIVKGIFNVCADLHPTHQDFYPHQAVLFGLEAPEYSESSPDADMKIIDNSLLKNKIAYQYLYPDPMGFFA
jgi:nucleoside-diphosphate-sugar epimerase